MDSALFGSLVTVQSAPASSALVSAPSAPAKAFPRDRPGSTLQDGSFELARIGRSATASAAIVDPTSSASSPVDTSDVEMSRPSSPLADAEGVDVMHGLNDPPMNKWRFVAVCLMNFVNGLNDSAAGALIPYMEKHYNIGYAVVSLIFVGTALGFITAAVVLDSLRNSLGSAKMLALGLTLMAAGYVPIVAAAPFPVVAVAFFLPGFGSAVNIATGNLFCGSLRNGTTMLGGMHGAYGLGGTLGPLVATAMVAARGMPWSRYYVVTLALTAFNAAFAAWAFWRYEAELGETPAGPVAEAAERRPAAARTTARTMVTALHSRVVILGALFIFAYQGAEVSISGWVISFLITARGGDPSRVGYVTAGFWAGITLGRLLLSAPAHRVGERAFVYAAVLGAAGFELLVWWVPNVVGDAVAVAVVGLLLGPIYPCATAVLLRIMGRQERLSGLGVVSAFGSSGGAAAPFTTGILAQAAGTFVLHPIAIGLFAVMLVCWWCLPKERKRAE